MKFWREARRFLAFNAVGVATTVVGIPVMILLDKLGVPYAAYTALNYLIGIALGFWLNFRFVFQHHKTSPAKPLLRYLVCFLILLAAVQALQYGLIEGLGWPRWTGVGVGMIVYGGLGYVASRWWVFRPDRR